MIRNFFLLLCFCSVLVEADGNSAAYISCEPTQIFKCTPEKCEKFRVVNIDEVQYFEIDAAKKTLSGKIGTATLHIENIVNRHGNANTFVFFGTHADSEFDWILRINKKSGKMILVSTNADLDGFTTYGTCTWETK